MTHSLARILVPTDFSPASDRALSLGKDIARKFDAQIYLLHVRAILDVPNVDSELLDEVERILTDSEPRTQAALGRAGEDRALTIHARIERGIVPADVILDAVSEHDCDLVIMGTHGQRGFRRMLTGSVAQEVVHRSPVPVLTTRAEGGSTSLPRKILVAVDFSEGSLKAVEWATSMAPALDAEITLLHVTEPLIYPEFYALDSLPEQHRELITKRCRSALTDVAEKYLADVPFTTAVIQAHVAKGISHFAEENHFDLVVLATRGLTGVAHAVLGSVAERVVRLSKAPVLTVRVD